MINVLIKKLKILTSFNLIMVFPLPPHGVGGKGVGVMGKYRSVLHYLWERTLPLYTQINASVLRKDN
jgi:hypothetical protein